MYERSRFSPSTGIKNIFACFEGCPCLTPLEMKCFSRGQKRIIPYLFFSRTRLYLYRAELVIGQFRWFTVSHHFRALQNLRKGKLPNKHDSKRRNSNLPVCKACLPVAVDPLYLLVDSEVILLVTALQVVSMDRELKLGCVKTDDIRLTLCRLHLLYLLFIRSV